MNRCPIVGSFSAEAPVLARLCPDLNWASDRPTVSYLRPSDHPVLLSSLLLLCNSSSASRNWTVRPSGSVIFILPTTQCTKCTDACTDGTVGSSDGVNFLPFLPRFWPLKIILSSQFGIDHFVMNHQNQTRTNGIWGHVHYNIPLVGDLWQHKQSKHNFLQKLTELEPLTLAWILTIIQTPPRSNSPLFNLLFLCSHIACLFPLWNH
jgi:hypothetical protein